MTRRWREPRWPAAAGVLLGLASIYAVGVGETAGAAPTPAPDRLPLPLAAFHDGPPARVTGGFGEDSCFACHWDGQENDGPGELWVGGLPANVEPGAAYHLQVKVARPGMKVAGFQLAVRHRDATQAGDLTVPGDEEGRVVIISDRDVQFAQHLSAGTSGVDGEVRWDILWTAPSSGDTIVLHVAAVAGDGDASQMGDHVRTAEIRTTLRQPDGTAPRGDQASGSWAGSVE